MHVIRRGSLWRAIRNLHSSSLAKDRTDEPRIRKKEVTLSGIQPTGTPHLGNYLGALRQWTALQDSTGLDNNECIFQIADLHALTSSSSKAKSTTTAKESIAMGTALLAMGIDPSKSLLLRQSLVPQHSELAWILFCQTPIGWLKRMHQWKSKAGGAPGSDSTAAEEAVSIGLLSYPVLQAADILLYQTTQVPVGEDQAQHLNLAAMIARSFNSKVKDRVFQVPRALLVSSEGKRIMSLKTPTKKMSKSDPASGSRILLTDTDDVIASKIRKATVDSEIGISYDPEGRPGLSNLLHILSSLNGIEPSKLAQIHAKSSNQSFKELVADEIIQVLRPIRSEMYRLEKDPEFVLSVLEQGEAKARERAQKTMVRVKLALGLPESAPHL